MKSNLCLEKLIIRNLRGLCPLGALKEFNWQSSSNSIKHLEFDELNLNVLFSATLLDHLEQNDLFLPALETFRLVPFRVENSDQGLEMVGKVTSLVQLRVKKKKVEIRLNSEHPIRNPLKDMDTQFPETVSDLKAL